MHPQKWQKNTLYQMICSEAFPCLHVLNHVILKPINMTRGSKKEEKKSWKYSMDGKPCIARDKENLLF